jgi:hypothetical protein
LYFSSKHIIVKCLRSFTSAAGQGPQSKRT